MKVLGAVLCVAVVLGSPVSAASVLLTQFDFTEAGYGQIKTALEAKGHTVDIVDAKTGGSIATALASGNYSQVYLYDLTSQRYINQDDIDAIDDFFATHKSIVQDSRSYGYYFQGTNASEVALIQNIAAEFETRGGGLWVGTDHDPLWTNNANPVLTALGFNPITGSYGDAVNSFDPASVLLTGVMTTDLWAAGQTVGSVSLGIQPNGIDMRFHFGHSSPARGAIPYISASFGAFVAPDEDRPSAVPVPAAGALLLTGLLGMLGLRRRKSAV